MSKIIKLDGENVTIGTDDGRVKEVKIYDIQFAPAVGDEVEIFESEGKTIVTKVEKKDNNVNNNYYTQPPVKPKNYRIWLIITILANIGFCFLPIISVSVLGFTVTINYVVNAGHIADGVILIAIQVVALIALACKGRIFPFILEILATGVFGVTVYNLIDNMSSSTASLSLTSILGIGFYLLALSLILCLIFAGLNLKKR